MRSEYDIARRRTEAYRQAERERRARRMSDPVVRGKERARQRAAYKARRKPRIQRACEECGAPVPLPPERGRTPKTCSACKTEHRRRWAAAHRKTTGYRLSAKKLDARRRGIAFSLTKADLPPVPSACPALGVQFDGKGYRLTLDRINPALGYVPGNVQWLSARANAIKTNATAAEIDAVARFMRHKLLE